MKPDPADPLVPHSDPSVAEMRRAAKVLFAEARAFVRDGTEMDPDTVALSHAITCVAYASELKALAVVQAMAVTLGSAMASNPKIAEVMSNYLVAQANATFADQIKINAGQGRA